MKNKLKALWSKWIKIILNKKDKPLKLEDYFIYKNVFVTLKANKKKVKLRKYISNLSRQLSEFNDFGYKTNRDELIAAFNKGSLEGVNKHYQEQIQLFIKSRQKLSVA